MYPMLAGRSVYSDGKARVTWAALALRECLMIEFAKAARRAVAATSRHRESMFAFQKAEIEKWWPIIKEANIRAHEAQR
jgi:hypothetical protein